MVSYREALAAVFLEGYVPISMTDHRDNGSSCDVDGLTFCYF